MAALKVQFKERQVGILAVGTLVASLGLAGVLFRLAGRQDALVWCRNYVLATIDGDGFGGTVTTAVILAVAAASLINAAAFLAREWFRIRTLRRDIGRRQVAMPGRVTAAAAGVGAPGEAIVVIADEAPAAFTFGLAGPKIVLTTGLLSTLTRGGLKAVLAHELSHLQRRDPLRSLSWELLRRLFFFLPALREVASFASVRREIAADARAQQAAGRHALASALLRIVARGRPMVTVAPFGHIRTRVAALASPAAGRSMEISASRLAVTAIVTAAILAANAAYGAPFRARDDTSPPSCENDAPRMSQINFSPYLRIDVERPMMSSAVQSSSIAP